MDRGERDLFTRSLRAALEQHTGPALDEALGRLGWYEALATDPRTALASLFELQGLLNVTSRLDPVLASVLCPDDPRRAVVLPAFGTRGAPGVRQNGAIAVHGVGSPWMASAPHALLAVTSEVGVELVGVTTVQLRLRTLAGLDPALGMVEVGGTLEMGQVDPVAPAGPPGDRAWSRALSLARFALSHELIGASRAMLRLARDHATERVQFGRPIGSFQAVRHRLADGLVAVEAAAASVDAAWEEGSELSATVAKAVAGRSALTVARHAQQVLAGIGFTAEHPLHRYVKRTLVLDQLLGSSASTKRSVGREILNSRALPPAVPL